MPRIPTTEFITNPKRYGYDIRLDKLLLRSAPNVNTPMTIASSDVQAGQNVNVKQNPEDFTSNLGRIYSRNNFNSGQGLDTAHRADAEPDDTKRFWDSKGIDVFHGDDEVSYNVHLLYTTLTQNKSFSGTNNYLAQTTNGDVYVTDTTNIHKYNASSSSWSTIAAGTSGASHNFTGIAAFGNGLYLTTANGTSGSQLIKFDGSSWSTLTTAQSSSGGLTGVWYVKNRLWISGNDGTAEYLWEKSPFDAWNTGWLADGDTIVEIEPTHSITGVVDGGAAVLASSTDGTVYSFKLSSAVFVNQGQTKIPYEEIHSIAAAEGIIFIGTKEVSRDVGRLYKLELVAADNLYVLANRQLIKEWVTAVDTTPKAMFVSRDSVYIGIKEATNETNLWRYYLPTGGLARDLQTVGNGFVQGIVQSNGKFVICVAGSDVYIETSTYESTGYLITSAADFFTAESKQFVGAEISTKELPDNTSVELLFSNNFEDLDTPGSSNYERAINQVSGTGDNEVQIKPIARYIIGKLILNSDGVDTPKVKSLQFRALARPELVVAQIPINISDRVERPGRTPVKVKELGDALYNELRLLEGDAVTLEIFDPNEVIKGVVESISYPVISNSERGSVTQIAILTVRGTRQQTITEPTSVHLFGGEVLGRIRFGA